jgi:hypothetical protein
MLSRMSMPGYRPSLTLRVAWVGLPGLSGAVIGVMIAWYSGLLRVLMTLGPADRAPGSRPPDLLGRLVQLLWPKGLAPLALLGTVAGVALAVHRAGVGDRSPQRWRSRVWQLGGGALGALVGVPGAALLVGLWSILTLRSDPDALPPSPIMQSADGVVFGLLVAVPLASSLVGSWSGAVLGRRVIRRDVTTSR